MPSGTQLASDAPADNQGRGESFSPTDLVATALGSCMATIMGIAASSRNIELEGMSITVQKHMSADLPRRIDRLDLEVFMPLAESHPDKKVLQAAAMNCPVQHSIHPEITVNVQWHWLGGESPE
ncbi:OsmC family protein [Verrucomicrobiaceae bacterium 227]